MEIKDLIIVKYNSRPNRFTIEFIDDNKKELAHLHDPGRLKELLITDTNILVKYVPTYKKTSRKTKYDVIAIEYQNEWVLLNSSYHNQLVNELISNEKIDCLKDFKVLKPEIKYGKSRLDFLLENKNHEKMYLEVKGCTLVTGDLAKFPDAPTIRGKKHVEELIKIQNQSELSTIIILILQNGATSFMPNYETDPDFSETLKKAYDSNVKILPTHIITKYDNNKLTLTYDKILPIIFR